MPDYVLASCIITTPYRVDYILYSPLRVSSLSHITQLSQPFYTLQNNISLDIQGVSFVHQAL